MRSYTYSEARQNLASLLDLAESEDVEIRRKDGSVFILRARQRTNSSPFDVPGINAQVGTEEILDAIRESRTR